MINFRIFVSISNYEKIWGIKINNYLGWITSTGRARYMTLFMEGQE